MSGEMAGRDTARRGLRWSRERQGETGGGLTVERDGGRMGRQKRTRTHEGRHRETKIGRDQERERERKTGRDQERDKRDGDTTTRREERRRRERRRSETKKVEETVKNKSPV